VLEESCRARLSLGMRLRHAAAVLTGACRAGGRAPRSDSCVGSDVASDSAWLTSALANSLSSEPRPDPAAPVTAEAALPASADSADEAPRPLNAPLTACAAPPRSCLSACCVPC
jgi:hypothetical protein